MKKMFVWMAAAVVMMTNVACAGGNKAEQMTEDQRREQVERLLVGINETNYAEKMDSLRLLYPEIPEAMDVIEAYCQFMVEVATLAEGKE